MSVIAVIFDYDDTLVPDSTTQLLKHHDIDTKKFWGSDFKDLVKNKGYDPPLAYLKLILDNIGEDKPLGNLNNKRLREVGATIEETMYPGVKNLFDDLRSIVKRYNDKGLEVSIEFYIISGGLEEVILGNEFLKNNCQGIYGCRLIGDTEDSELKYIKRIITFTEKTRYLFEINKGIPQEVSDSSPDAVNTHVEETKRRVSFDNMIYVGDGYSDIPCFSLIMKASNDKGDVFGVYHNRGSKSDRLNVFTNIIKARRVRCIGSPNYNADKILGDHIRLAVENNCTNLLKKTRAPYNC